MSKVFLDLDLVELGQVVVQLAYPLPLMTHSASCYSIDRSLQIVHLLSSDCCLEVARVEEVFEVEDQYAEAALLDHIVEIEDAVDIVVVVAMVYLLQNHKKDNESSMACQVVDMQLARYVREAIAYVAEEDSAAYSEEVEDHLDGRKEELDCQQRSRLVGHYSKYCSDAVEIVLILVSFVVHIVVGNDDSVVFVQPFEV